jgi:hypothetical protein
VAWPGTAIANSIRRNETAPKREGPSLAERLGYRDVTVVEGASQPVTSRSRAGLSLQAFVTDPEGNQVELRQPPSAAH